MPENNQGLGIQNNQLVSNSNIPTKTSKFFRFLFNLFVAIILTVISLYIETKVNARLVPTSLLSQKGDFNGPGMSFSGVAVEAFFICTIAITWLMFWKNKFKYLFILLIMAFGVFSYVILEHQLIQNYRNGYPFTLLESKPVPQSKLQSLFIPEIIEKNVSVNEKIQNLDLVLYQPKITPVSSITQEEQTNPKTTSPTFYATFYIQNNSNKNSAANGISNPDYYAHVEIDEYSNSENPSKDLAQSLKTQKYVQSQFPQYKNTISETDIFGEPIDVVTSLNGRYDCQWTSKDYLVDILGYDYTSNLNNLDISQLIRQYLIKYPSDLQ